MTHITTKQGNQWYLREVKLFAYSRGNQQVAIGDKYNWTGINAGVYEVVSFGDSNIYSPSGFGGTSTVFIKNENGETVEWCGDSVASGVASGFIENNNLSLLILNPHANLVEGQEMGAGVDFEVVWQYSDPINDVWRDAESEYKGYDTRRVARLKAPQGETKESVIREIKITEQDNTEFTPVKETLEQAADNYMKKTICPLNAIMAFIAGGKWQHPVTLQTVIEVIEGEIAGYQAEIDTYNLLSKKGRQENTVRINALESVKQKLQIKQ